MQLAYILFAFVVVGTYAEDPEQLVSGTPTSIEQYPHAASMRMYNSHMCGGSIIAPNFIVTAAHCVVGMERNINSITVVTGTTMLTSGGQVHRVARFYYHPSYNTNTPGRDAGFDIGLIQLATPMQYNARQQPVRLPSRDVSQGDRVTVIAWGSTGFRQQVHPDLRKIDAACMAPSTCQQYHQNFMKIHQTNEFCTLISQGVGTCNGDSGSGVVRVSDGCIVGLVSGGRPCALGYPDVKTNVFKFNSWIRSIVPGV